MIHHLFSTLALTPITWWIKAAWFIKTESRTVMFLSRWTCRPSRSPLKPSTSLNLLLMAGKTQISQLSSNSSLIRISIRITITTKLRLLKTPLSSTSTIQTSMYRNSSKMMIAKFHGMCQLCSSSSSSSNSKRLTIDRSHGTYKFLKTRSSAPRKADSLAGLL